MLAWFAVGAFLGEEPQQAAPGQSYPLVERSNCRYDSGHCDLHNEDMQLSITFATASPDPPCCCPPTMSWMVSCSVVAATVQVAPMLQAGQPGLAMATVAG